MVLWKMKTRTIAGLRSRLPYRHLLSELLFDLIIDAGFRVHELRWICVLLYCVVSFAFIMSTGLYYGVDRRSYHCIVVVVVCSDTPHVSFSFFCYRIPLKLRLLLHACTVCFGLQMDFLVDAYIADRSGWTNT
jgi:hypothetical protein